MSGMYWPQEQSGLLAEAVTAYLRGERMDAAQMAFMRAYLRRWMDGPWRGDDVPALRVMVEGLHDRAGLDAWFDRALASGIDPL